jgi:hypothetical protein
MMRSFLSPIPIERILNGGKAQAVRSASATEQRERFRPRVDNASGVPE